MDLVLFGHVHNYERTCAIYQDRCKGVPRKGKNGIDTYYNSNYTAPVHVIVGTAGFSLDKFPSNVSLLYSLLFFFCSLYFYCLGKWEKYVLRIWVYFFSIRWKAGVWQGFLNTDLRVWTRREITYNSRLVLIFGILDWLISCFVMKPNWYNMNSYKIHSWYQTQKQCWCWIDLNWPPPAWYRF